MPATLLPAAGNVRLPFTIEQHTRLVSVALASVKVIFNAARPARWQTIADAGYQR